MKKLIYFILFPCMVLFINCNKSSCTGIQEGDEYTEIPEKYKVPLQSYTGFDTLKFKSEKGIIYTFYGQGLDSGYKIRTTTSDSYCTYTNHEHRRYYYYLFKSVTYPDLEYVVTCAIDNNGVPDLEININNYIYYRFATLPGIGSSGYLNNIVIDSITYNNVLKIFENFDAKSTEFLYYSLKEGIIKIFYKDGKTLTKIK